MNWQVAWHAENGDHLDPAAASAVKVLRHRVLHGGPAPKLLEILGPVASVRDGSPDAVLHGRLSPPAAGPARADLRRRHQRAAARPHRHLRPGPPRLAPLTRPDPTCRRPLTRLRPGIREHEDTHGLRTLRGAAGDRRPGRRRSSPTCAPQSGCARSRPARTGSTATSGPSWPRPACSASPCPSRSAAAASASSRPASCSSARDGRSRRCRCSPTLVAALAIAEFGTDAQQTAWLPGVVAGETVLTVALAEIGADSAGSAAGCRARAAATGCCRARRPPCRPMHLAAAVIVPARDPEGDVRLFVVPTDAAGLTIERQDTFNHEPQFHVDLRRRRSSAADGELDGHRQLDGDGQAPIDWIVDRATVALCAHGRRRQRRRHAPHRRLRRPSASSSTGPSAPSRPSATAWPTATSTTRPSA